MYIDEDEEIAIQETLDKLTSEELDEAAKRLERELEEIRCQNSKE